jgi:hypothetical protein
MLEVRDHIAYLTLNRPEVHNAINPELMVQLAQAWERVAADDSIRVAVVTGAGEKSFSAGADLARLLPLTTGERQPEDEWDHVLLKNPELRTIAMLHPFDLHKPVIAAVNGYCIGRYGIDAYDRHPSRGGARQVRPDGGKMGPDPICRLAGAHTAPNSLLQCDGVAADR